MAIGLKRKWQGNIRLRLERTTFHLATLLTYNSKHPTYDFLPPVVVENIISLRSTIAAMLAAKTLK